MTVRMLSLDRQGFPDSYIIEPGNNNTHFSSSGYNIDSEIAGDDGDESGSSSNRHPFNQSQQQYIRPDMHLPPLRVMYSQGQHQSNNNSSNNNHLPLHNQVQPLLKMQLSPPRATHTVINNNYTSHTNHNIHTNNSNNITSGKNMNLNLSTPMGSLDRDRDHDIGT